MPVSGTDLLTTLHARIDWRATLAFGLPFLLFCLTVAPTVYNLDSAELTTAAATGGLVRSTGYPLYLLLGGVWAQLPVGDAGLRLNLFSALCGAITALLLDHCLRRLGVGRIAALAAIGLLVSSVYFWSLSVVAEVYTLQTALVATLILLALRWTETPSVGRFAAFGLVFGLALSHHGATRLLAPGFAVYFLIASARKALAPLSLIAGITAFLVGLLPHLWLPFRQAADPAFNYAGLYDVAGRFHPFPLERFEVLLWYVSGSAFGGQMFAYSIPEWLGELGGFLVTLWRSFFGVGIGPALLGIAVLARRNWRLSTLLASLFLLNVVFFSAYRVVDKDTMFLPAYLIWSIWLAVGLEWLVRWVGHSAGRLAPVSLRVVLAGIVAVSIAWNWRLADRSRDRSAYDLGQAVLAELESEALYVGWWETVPVVQYLQLVEGRRSDVTVINRFLIREEDLHSMLETSIGRRPVYIDSPPSHLPAHWVAEPAGPIHRLVPSG